MNSIRYGRSVGLRGRWLAALACLGAGMLTGCGGSSSNDTGRPDDPIPDSVTFDIRVADVTGKPIAGADVAVTGGEQQFQATTNGRGVASFADVPSGDGTIVVSAAGFDVATLDWWFGGNDPIDIALYASRAWAVGLPIVLGTRVVEVAENRGSMTFELDLAIIGDGAEPVETLAGDDLTLNTIDCGWGGPRDCISDAAGNHKGNYSGNSPMLSFGLMPPSQRHAYRVGVLAERSRSVADWEHRVPALKSFFTTLGGNDAVSLASVQTGDDGTTLSILGPYTNDGSSYLEAIDGLALPAGDTPDLQPSLLDWIREAAKSEPGETPGAVRSVLVAATPWMTVEEIAEATALARESGVQISIVTGPKYGYGLPEMAVRSGGFVTILSDPRQLGLVFGTADRLLAGDMPFYRIAFRLDSGPGVFESGGNAKIYMRVRVPTSIPHNGVHMTFDVAIP